MNTKTQFKMSNMLTPIAPQTTNHKVYVGAPGIGKPFSIHPTDQTDPDSRVNLYFNKGIKRMFILNASTYPDIEHLYRKRLFGLTSSVLYRGIYLDGDEFLLPVHDYAANTPLSLNQVVVVGQSGEWLVRENDQYDLFSSKKKPNWSDHSFEELFEMAFDGFVIDDEDHPLVEKFRFV